MKNNKPQSTITREKLTAGILVALICVPIVYLVFIVMKTQNRPFGTRSSEAILGTMLDIAPPWFWAFLLSCLFLFEIVRLSIQYVRQKKEEKREVEEE